MNISWAVMTMLARAVSTPINAGMKTFVQRLPQRAARSTREAGVAEDPGDEA